jgi:hypothetical protein
MKLSIIALIIGLAVVLYLVVYRRKEGYVQEIVSPDEIAGTVDMTSYDNKETKRFEVVVDGKYFMLKGKNENGIDFYVAVKDGDITNTNTVKPQGEYKFRLVKALNGDDGYYSLAMDDSERYFMIDVTNNDAGIFDLTGVDDLSKKVMDPRSFNFRFKKI